MPERQLYWNISDIGHYLIYPLFILAVVIFCYGYYQRYKLWRIGQAEDRKNVSMGIKDMLIYGLGQKRILQDRYPGLMHAFIFYGFVVLFITTTIVAIQADFGILLFRGWVYVILKVAANTLGVLACVGIIMAWYRRYIKKSARLDEKQGQGDALVLALIFIILITGFIVQGLRVVGTNDPYAVYSYMGLLMAPLFRGMSTGLLEGLHKFLWYLHMVLAMAFIACIPYTKLSHIFTGLANQFFRHRGPVGVPETIDFEDEDLETFGKSHLAEFSWKALFNTDACIRCGRCQEICPAQATGKDLNPKRIIQDMYDHMLAMGKAIEAQKKESDALENEGKTKEEIAASTPMPLEEDLGLPALIGEVVPEEELWQCTTCRACEQVCPMFVEHVDKTIDMRRNLVLMESRFPAEAQLSFRNLENNGNPWGIGYTSRQDFLKSLEVPTLEEHPYPEVLYWPGCFGAFDARNQKVAEAMVKLMRAAGVDFSIIGNEEKCCGDPARRLGNEYLFFMLASENIEVMNRYNVKKIVTQCPHCYNVLKHEYPAFEGKYEVIHHTEFLQSLIAQGKLKVDGKDGRNATFHDSCYLGRYSGIYEAPRKLLQDAGFASVREMEQNHGKSFCCGAGGGMMWLEEHQGERINVMRTQQAIDTGADVLASACPYCLTMLKDGIAAKEAGDNLVAMDVAELLAEQVS